MKIQTLHRHLASLLMFLFCFNGHSQEWNMKWNADAVLSAGTEEILPFWARTGHHGVIPERSSGVVRTGLDLGYMSSDSLFFEAGTQVAARCFTVQGGGLSAYALMDRLYVSGGWRMLRLDVGMRPRRSELGPLSLTGGNIVWTSNARNIPGIDLRSDWIYLDRSHVVGIRGNLAHYQPVDDRYVSGMMIHDKSLELKFSFAGKVEVSGGIEHIAQWGGVSPSVGPQPSSFQDYMKVFFACRGGEGAHLSDQLNVLGNHLGREYMRILWNHETFGMTFQYDKPYEDGSGTRLQNFPDGVWTLKFSLRDRKAAVTDILYEFVSTTLQSGPVHDRPATEEEMAKQDPNSHYYGRVVIGGCDNYFNNGIYRSGWTYYGRSIGLPLINGVQFNEDGVAVGILNNRVRAHHFGISGNAWKVPYTFKATYSRNYGCYGQVESSFYTSKPWQLSLALEACVNNKVTRMPVDIHLGLYSDVGELYPDSFGLTLKFSYAGSRLFKKS